MCANSAGVQSVRPALPCSFVLSAVSVLLTIALPASSGWARISRTCTSCTAPRTVAASASFRPASEWKGRFAQVASAIHGECS